MKKFKKIKKICSVLLIAFLYSCTINPSITKPDSKNYMYDSTFDKKNISKLSPKIINEPIILAKPEAISSDKIKTEINDINSHKINSDEEYRIGYWSNSIEKWLEIAKSLGVKYNKLESELSSVNNYLVNSQYDSLLNTYQNKYLYNRSFRENNRVISFPSEKAAIAEVSANILIYFYPEEKDFLLKRAKENKETAFWGKENLRSDIEAGGKIGQIISEKTIEIIKTKSYI